MAINDIVQTIAESRVDARSLSEFIFKPAGFKVARRLAPPIDTLQFYIDRFNSLNGDFSSSVSGALSSLNSSVAEADGKVAYIETTVQDAINNTAVEGGVLADTFVTVTANGVGTVARTLRDVNSEKVSIKDFGVVGDGVADDTTGVENAINSGLSIDWLDVKCKITRPISTTYPKGSVIKWYGKGATITYAGAHTEYVIRMSGSGVKYDLSGEVSIICGKLANKGLEVLNNSASMTDAELSYFVSDNLKISGIKRIKGFGGGDALFVRGGFSAVELRSGCEFFDVELPALQGTSGAIGVTGVTVSHYGLTGYCKELICDGAKISKVYSSDLDYYDDQDGLRYLCPRDASGNIVVSKLTVTSKSKFKNCYGRSIKTQCMFTDVKSASFERSEGGNLGYGNPEIDAQFGYLNVGSLTFTYSNGFTASTCIASSTDAGQKVSGFNIDDVQVFLEAGTVLRTFASTFPRDGEIVPSTINNVKIFGTVEMPISYLCNGSKNKLEVSNFYVEKFADVNSRGTPKGLITVITSGSITPYRALVVAHNNSTADTTLPALVVDRVAGTSMISTTSMWSNIGFLDNNNASYGSDNVNSMQVNRSGLIGKKFVQDGSSQRSGAFGIQDTIGIESGAMVRIPARTSGGCKVDIVAAYNKTAFASLYVYGKTIAVIAKGVPFEVADAIEPETGLFRVWAENTNEICIKNTDSSSRVFTVFVISNH